MLTRRIVFLLPGFPPLFFVLLSRSIRKLASFTWLPVFCYHPRLTSCSPGPPNVAIHVLPPPFSGSLPERGAGGQGQGALPGMWAWSHCFSSQARGTRPTRGSWLAACRRHTHTGSSTSRLNPVSFM
ncbi:hypothetical protein B0T18DRAFT_174818 [Schizothecium vesticola]|uniref:Uncharacterized protein n=1 Tax=Schizothecium vesticola TaxID=314040 RepID=A0AA40EPF0_9PEZI|nr:hypothetical protein B0T18DRAFT_174818 [Schizothecium vesticola]